MEARHRERAQCGPWLNRVLLLKDPHVQLPERKLADKEEGEKGKGKAAAGDASGSKKRKASSEAGSPLKGARAAKMAAAEAIMALQGRSSPSASVSVHTEPEAEADSAERASPGCSIAPEGTSGGGALSEAPENFIVGDVDFDFEEEPEIQLAGEEVGSAGDEGAVENVSSESPRTHGRRKSLYSYLPPGSTPEDIAAKLRKEDFLPCEGARHALGLAGQLLDMAGVSEVLSGLSPAEASEVLCGMAIQSAMLARHVASSAQKSNEGL